jgi:uncharacterized protein YfaS (alpha-2-macroglobulin family)
MARNGREFEINPDHFTSLIEYVRRVARGEGSTDFSTLYMRAYAVYVLALAGQSDALELIGRFDHLSMPRTGRAWLAATLAIGTGDAKRGIDYLNTMPLAEWREYLPYGVLHSPLRASAVELLTLCEIGDTDFARMDALAAEITAILNQGRYYHLYTTQENAFVITALMRYYDRMAQNFEQCRATIAWEGGAFELQGAKPFNQKLKGAGASFTIANTGPVPIVVAAVAGGVPLQPETEAVSEGITINRTLLNREGAPLIRPPRQGETCIVRLEIITPLERHNVVVSDLLPAGLEIENPRLSGLDAAAFVGSSMSIHPNHLEVRDDRLIAVFDRIAAHVPPKGKLGQVFYYTVNAITPGTFEQPASTIECMYDPRAHGATAPGALTIE